MWNALARLRGRAKKMISIACSFVVALSVVLHSETAALAAQPTVPKDSTAFVGAEPKVATTLNASVMRNIARNPSRVEFQSTQLQAGPSTSSGGKKHGLGGALIGAAVGIGAGFLIAGMTDYPLKEGGGYEVILKGSVIGGVVGLWTGASIGKDWTKTGKTQISLRGAWTTSLAHRDIQNVFKEAGYLPTNSDSWHPYSPSLAVTHEIRKNVSMGVEISGISAQNVRSGTYDLYESVDGTCYGLFLSLAPRPTPQRRFTYEVSSGLDFYVVPSSAFLNYWSVYPEPQPSALFDSKYHGLGIQLKGGIQYAIVRDVALQAGVTGHWAGSVKINGISGLYPTAGSIRSLPSHTVRLSSVHCYVGIGVRL